jgi:hypothetical protein
MRFFQLVETPTLPPAFKAWFGQSKVVDASGQPLRVYHGTEKDFDEFGYGIQPGADQIGSGFYFTTDPAEASGYAGGSQGARVIPAYLSIQNPLDADKVGTLTPVQAAKIIQMSPRLEDVFGDWDDGSGNKRQVMATMANTYAFQNGNIVRRLFSMANDIYGDQHADAFNKALHVVLGYDGVFKTHDDCVHWVAWFPQQVKAATNSGTFDPANPKFTEAFRRP